MYTIMVVCIQEVMMDKEVILKAIILANKLGARGIQVTDYIESTSAMQSPDLRLVAQEPLPQSATAMMWYD